VHPLPARQPFGDEVNNKQQSLLGITAEHDPTPSKEEEEEAEEGRDDQKEEKIVM